MTESNLCHEQALERLVADITHAEGRVVTNNDEEWLRWRVSDLHMAVAASDNPPFEIAKRTRPVEQALRALASREEPLTHQHVLVMERAIRGLQSPDIAADMLPTPSLDDVSSSSITVEPALAEKVRQGIAGLIWAFQVERDDGRVYCKRCKTEHQRRPSDLDLHNQRRHAEDL